MHYRGRHRRQDQAASNADALMQLGIEDHTHEQTSDDTQATRVVLTGPQVAIPPGPDNS
jgi:hypothetical protein